MRIAILSCFFLLGCSTIEHRGSLERLVNEQRYSSEEFRQLMNNFVAVSIARIDAAAEQAITNSTSADAQYNIMRWRLAAVQAYFMAASHQDVGLSAMDTIVLMAQQKAFLNSPAAQQAFAAQSQTISAAGLQVVEDFKKLVPLIEDDDKNYARIRQRILDLAAQNPITNVDYIRSSVLPELLKVNTKDKRTLLSVLTETEDRFASLLGFSRLYMNRIPDLLRWHIELEAHQLRHGPEAKQLSTLSTSVEGTLQRVNTLIDATPLLLKHERDKAYATINTLQTSLNKHIADAKAMFDKERQTIGQEVKALETKLHKQITTEKTAALAFYEQERGRLLSDVQKLADAAIVDLRTGLSQDLSKQLVKEMATELPEPLAAQVEQSALNIVDSLMLKLAIPAGLVFLIICGFWFATIRALKQQRSH